MLARYEEAARPEAFRWSEWKAAQLDKVETSLAALDAAPQVLANRVDIGSIAVGCALWYLDMRFADLDWRQRHSYVAEWYTAYSQRPAMAANWSLG